MASSLLFLLSLSLTQGSPLPQSAPVDDPLLNPPVNPLTPSTILQDIQCYSLPIGGLGCISHFLTFETIVCLAYSRSPWRPWKRLEHYKADIILGALSVLWTLIISIVAIYRCRDSWPFILLLAWKLLLSVSLGCITLHRAYYLIKERDDNGKVNTQVMVSNDPIWGMALYFVGLAFGLVGLADVVWNSWPNRSTTMDIITGTFVATIILVALTGGIKACYIGSKDGWDWTALKWAVIAAIILAAFYSDWILAAIEVQGLALGVPGATGNWWGIPSGDVAIIYWPYFFAKRLPLFSS
ncbi:MAG: hypothetical protein MMC33_005888 [Icmadophila ericetorum]|nr:hypothetical protein [Icmadophila ericetorum]